LIFLKVVRRKKSERKRGKDGMQFIKIGETPSSVYPGKTFQSGIHLNKIILSMSPEKG
jgi:hypothetical protein